jgi:TonB family protein
MAEAWEQWHGEIVDGQYRLRQFLGGSDHSAVFVAERTSNNERVALKFIPAHPATAKQDLARYDRAAKLNHPNLAKVFGSGRSQLGDSSFLYVVSELADESLSQIVPQRALTAKEAGEMLRPLLSALSYLHQNGYAHGHVVPANIMAVGDQLKLSSDTVSPVGGTINSNGEELPEGERAGISKAADVWSLGATLVEVLTQRRAAWEETAHGEPLLREKLPEPFREIARRTLHRNAQRRPSIAEIQDLLAPSPSKPPQPRLASKPEPSGSEPTGSKRGLVIGIAAAVVLVALIGWTKLSSRPPQPQAAAVSPGLASAPSAEKETPKPSAKTEVRTASPAQAAKNQTPRTLPEPQPETAPATPPSTPRTTPTPRSGSAAQENAAKGSVAHQVLPEVSRSARNTITGRVRVAVRVAADAQGNVTDVNLESAGPSKYFARLASEASRQWKFTPPRLDGHDVASEWLLRYGFGRTDTIVSSTQLKP